MGVTAHSKFFFVTEGELGLTLYLSRFGAGEVLGADVRVFDQWLCATAAFWRGAVLVMVRASFATRRRAAPGRAFATFLAAFSTPAVARSTTAAASVPAADFLHAQSAPTASTYYAAPGAHCKHTPFLQIISSIKQNG